MRRSTDRILTTNVGALPAPDDVWAQLEVDDAWLGALCVCRSVELNADGGCGHV